MMDRKILIFGFILLLVIFTAGCSIQQYGETTIKSEDTNMMKITSPRFNNNESIPKKYTCDGENINPELHIEGVPANTGSLILIMDDPDAPGRIFVHWVVVDIDPDSNIIKENTDIGISVANSAGKTGYIGPCPPSGTHRYFFKIYAVDFNISPTFETQLKLDKNRVEKIMENHILAQALLIGVYGR